MKAVPMKAATTRRPLRPAWASALRMKCTLPRGVQDLADRALDAFVRIRDDKLDAAQTAPGELAQERGPERLRLRWTDIHAEDLAPAIAVDAHRNDHSTATMRPLSKSCPRAGCGRSTSPGSASLRRATPPPGT